MGAGKYLLEKPLGADFALVKAEIADEEGNCFVAKAEKNFNIVMAMAAKHTIVQAGKIVKKGELDPEKVNIPGVFTSVLVEASK